MTKGQYRTHKKKCPGTAAIQEHNVSIKRAKLEVVQPAHGETEPAAAAAAAQGVSAPEPAVGMDTPEDVLMTEEGLPPLTAGEDIVSNVDAGTVAAVPASAAAATSRPSHPPPCAEHPMSQTHAAAGAPDAMPHAALQPAVEVGAAPDQPLQPEPGGVGVETMEMDAEGDAAAWLADCAAQAEESGGGSDSDSDVEEASDDDSDESEPDEDDGSWGDYDKLGSSAYRFLHRDDPVFPASSQPSTLSIKGAVFLLMDWRRRHSIRIVAFEELLRMLAEAGLMPENNAMAPSLYHARRIVGCALA